MIVEFLESTDNYLWAYIAVPLLISFGFYLTCKTRFLQLRQIPFVLRTFARLLKFWKPPPAGSHGKSSGFIATMGGCTGIGNVVAVCTAIQLGGPGALFWIWVTALAGMTLKYAEVYLGVRFRETTHKGGMQGGPMYYLRKVFKGSIIPTSVCFLLCIYGVEIYQFSVIANSITLNLDVEKTYVVIPLLILIIGASSFFRTLRNYSLSLVPLLFAFYFIMSFIVIAIHITEIPGVIATVLSSAFTGHAAVGAFAGSSLLVTMSQGIRRGCYASDVGVGYAAVVHSQVKEAIPEKQASLAVFDIFLDSFIICTTSVILVIVTGVWKDPIDSSLLIQQALGQYFPCMELFMPIFILFLGYATTSTYFSFGLTCAEHLCPKVGRKCYYVFGALSMTAFAYLGTSHALVVMSLTGGVLLIINLYAIYKLRHEICFKLPPESQIEEMVSSMEPELNCEIA